MKKSKIEHKLTGLTNERRINSVDVNSNFLLAESLPHTRGHWLAFRLVNATCEVLPKLCSLPLCNPVSGKTATGFGFYSQGDK
jgi:hypothetical protein